MAENINGGNMKRMRIVLAGFALLLFGACSQTVSGSDKDSRGDDLPPVPGFNTAKNQSSANESSGSSSSKGGGLSSSSEIYPDDNGGGKGLSGLDVTQYMPDEKLDCDCPTRLDVLENKEYLSKKSVWIFGGDGWAYDIGFGGVDHVLASGEDVNIMVFDTEVYSNTGGQASKASQIGQVAQFAAAGKAIAKKSLADIAISYGYIYVAQIAMGADQNQTLKAIREAEAYPGPSLIIGYAPCEMHSIKGGMKNCQAEMKKAVECGYWNMFRYNPLLKAEGKNPFILDSKEPKTSYRDFIMGEARYSALTRSFPERAEDLFQKAEEKSVARYEELKERSQN